MKKDIQIKIYSLATRIYDMQIPLISWLADKIRDITYPEEWYED